MSPPPLDKFLNTPLINGSTHSCISGISKAMKSRIRTLSTRLKLKKKSNGTGIFLLIIFRVLKQKLVRYLTRSIYLPTSIISFSSWWTRRNRRWDPSWTPAGTRPVTEDRGQVTGTLCFRIKWKKTSLLGDFPTFWE